MEYEEHHIRRTSLIVQMRMKDLKRPMDVVVSARRSINIAGKRGKTTALTSRAFSKASNTNPGSGKDANRCSL